MRGLVENRERALAEDSGSGVLRASCLLGGSRVVVSGVFKSRNMGYKYSYPTYNPTYNYP